MESLIGPEAHVWEQNFSERDCKSTSERKGRAAPGDGGCFGCGLPCESPHGVCRPAASSEELHDPPPPTPHPHRHFPVRRTDYCHYYYYFIHLKRMGKWQRANASDASVAPHSSKLSSHSGSRPIRGSRHRAGEHRGATRGV